MRPAPSAAAGAAAWWAVRHHTSPAVRRWRPGAGARHREGILSARYAGSGDLTVLLHGIVGNGDEFGGAFDVLAHEGRVVVPDLLGFGRSMAPDGTDVRREAHLRALDGLAVARRSDTEPVTVVGHSMGGVLALHWAARLVAAGRQVRVVTVCAPLYDSPAEADARIGALGPLARLIALDDPLSERVCAWMCAHRRLAAGVTVAASPALPVPIARGGVQHTWPAYSGAMDGLIRDSGWRTPFRALVEARVPVLLLEGGRDPVPVPGRAAALAAAHPTVRLAVQPRAGHDLPLADPRWCVERIRGAPVPGPRV